MVDAPMMMYVRPNIWALQPYRAARDDYSDGILLDANENALGPSLPPSSTTLQPIVTNAIASPSYSDTHLERYPDPHQQDVKDLISKLRNVHHSNIFLGVGSDECIDLAIRVFCKPAAQKVLICPPTYGMYSVAAQTNDVQVVKVNLNVKDGAFQLDVPKILDTITADPSITLLILCSPGNPTGTLLKKSDIQQILDYTPYKGIVMVDEAYIDFVEQEDEEWGSFVSWVHQYPNLVVTQTLSKSFGLAGIRLGLSISSPEIASIFNKTKAPYSISTLTSVMARAALSPDGVSRMKKSVSTLINTRTRLITQLSSLPRVGRVLGANHGNFVLAEMLDASTGLPSNEVALKLYKTLAEVEGVVVRFRGSEYGCEGCLRVTVGTEQENDVFVAKLTRLLDAKL
ncbi:histidinol-phosphate transaminase [Synchytrium microbalum]|uniref:histidinol-phosphate transaminase n=1 Tax=Synchytrium microbalum TaxID=1806994 RepID=A0A507C0V7_9FUNG|nr:histidinol-phosphate transaminase [Synchytrium microbalum]TPX32689.1 histidinol-phosphate transaminase [Synchytrium microbalum]